MTDARLPTTEQLVSEMAWVRQLARALVRDGAVADDIAQDTWLVAAEQKPDMDRPLRPWLARVARTLAFTRRRSEARRDQRDTAFDADRAVPTPEELVERVELQSIVAAEVLALEEPYRSTILLHFVEGYTSAEIARQLGIPAGTVRRRLKVALDQLRDALRARTDQPRRGWLAALVPLAKVPGPTPAAALGGIAMKKVIGALLGLLLLIGVGVLWWQRGRDAAPAPSTATTRRSTAVVPGTVVVAEVPPSSAIPGAPARRIAGRVVLRGAPVPGAKVLLGLEVSGEPTSSLGAPDAMSNVLQRIAEATTGPDGTFDFGVQPASGFTVSASAPDAAPALIRVDMANPRAATEGLVLALRECSTRLSGTIADASGGGIAKARISVAGLSGADSDESGAFTVCVTARDAPGYPSASVRVEADGYGTILQSVVVAGDLRHDFLLVPEAVLVGTLTTSDGVPVPGARVTANAEPSEMVRHLASGWSVTDRDGRFRIAGLAPGAFQLGAQVMGIGHIRVPAIARPATTSRDIRLVLPRTTYARVSGHVYAGGTPASGVRIASAQGDRLVGGTLSQADGSFVLVDVPYGPTKIFAGDAQSTAVAELLIDKPIIVDARIEIAKQSRIRGRVVRSGAPVADASVLFAPAPQATSYGPPPFARTDANGTFVLDGVPTGPGVLAAWNNATKAFAMDHPVDVAPGTDIDVEIDLAYAGEVTGTVVNGAGSPVPGVYVYMQRADGDGCESMTDAKGAFECILLAGGEYHATVTPSPGALQGFALVGAAVPIHVPQDGVTSGVRIAIVDERRAIGGTVVDDTGAPVPDVYIEAVVPGGPTMSPPSTLSDAAGHFQIANLAPGTYALEAHAADGSESTLGGVTAGTTTAALRLARAGAIEGTVVGFASTPTIFVFGANPMERMRGGRALVDGTSFSRPALPPGRYAVEATAGADADATIVDVEPGKTTRIEMRSRGAGTIEGTVSELGTRAPVPRMRCEGQTTIDGRGSRVPADPSYQAFTDPAGHFVVRAPIGRARIVCFPMPGPPTAGPPAMFSVAAADVDVTRDATTKVTLFSVRGTFGPAPTDPGFALSPALLPITVGQVIPSGPAAAVGLQVGDELLAVDGTPVTGLSPDGAMFLVLNHRPGTIAAVEISRGGAKQTLKIAVRGR